MRISDWSSDVCSSDLQLRRSDASPRRKRVCSLSEGSSLNQMTTAPGSASKSRSSSPWKSASKTAAAMTVRSEEHTSELQSLMRISYAVLCLKKQISKTDIKSNDLT